MILRHSKLHMTEICGKICHTYVAHAVYMLHICATYFASKSSAYFKTILRYKLASLILQSNTIQL